MKTRVIGCPKTIDGDLKCKEVPASFGFDTACKVLFVSSCSYLCLHIVITVYAFLAL
jgi:6-phosphofructokinase